MLQRYQPIKSSLFSFILILYVLCLGINCDASSSPFSPEDDKLLEEISYASFQYFWQEVHPASELVRDKNGVDSCSVASVGFQLACLPIGVERGYVSYSEANERAKKVLAALSSSDAHHKGVFAHFIDFEDGQITSTGYENSASTIDTALCIAGMLVAGEYFGGEIQDYANRIYTRVNWSYYVSPKNQQVCMAWTPDVAADMAGKGHFSKQTWDWYTDEVLLVSLLGISSPLSKHRLELESFTNWKRPVGRYKDGKSFIYNWPGTLFAYMFAQCFFDFQKMGDDPLGVDWFDNTTNAVIANRDWCRDNAKTFSTYGKDRWGITAGSGPGDRYVVPGHRPNGQNKDKPEEGTLHPYGAGMSVPFLPEDSMKALHEMRNFTVDGKPIWKSVKDGGYGFQDGFNVDEKWISGQIIGIAQGPMLLLIENARSGLIWDLMMKNKYIKAGTQRAGFKGVSKEARL